MICCLCHASQDLTHGSVLPSIFADWSVAHGNEAVNTHALQQPAGGAYKLHTAAAWVANDGHALFALATNAGAVLFVKMPPFGIQGNWC